jgi:hypothetical protein
VDEIEQKMEHVMHVTLELDVFFLKRMLRNLKYIFPSDLSMVDPYEVRDAVISSKTKKGTLLDEMQGTKMSTMVKFENINEKIDEVNEENEKQIQEAEEDDKAIKVEDEAEALEEEEKSEPKMTKKSKSKKK